MMLLGGRCCWSAVGKSSVVACRAIHVPGSVEGGKSAGGGHGAVAEPGASAGGTEREREAG